jgi:hypothetical protein
MNCSDIVPGVVRVAAVFVTFLAVTDPRVVNVLNVVPAVPAKFKAPGAPLRPK